MGNESENQERNYGQIGRLYGLKGNKAAYETQMKKFEEDKSKEMAMYNQFNLQFKNELSGLDQVIREHRDKAITYSREIENNISILLKEATLALEVLSGIPFEKNKLNTIIDGIQKNYVDNTGVRHKILSEILTQVSSLVTEFNYTKRISELNMVCSEIIKRIQTIESNRQQFSKGYSEGDSIRGAFDK